MHHPTRTSSTPVVGGENAPKSVAFHLSNFIRTLREELRQTQRWLKQAEAHSAPDSPPILKYRQTLVDLEGQIREASVDSPAFVKYMEEETSRADKIKADYSKRVESSLREREEQKQRLDKYYQDQREDRYKERQTLRQARRDFDRLLSIDASMPSYMRENLRQFPHNKGYIFKDVWYFGHQPLSLRRGEDPEVYVLFQRKFPGNTMLIHEIKYGHFHRIYEKKTKDSPKILIEDRPCPVRR